MRTSSRYGVVAHSNPPKVQGSFPRGGQWERFPKHLLVAWEMGVWGLIGSGANKYLTIDSKKSIHIFLTKFHSWIVDSILETSKNIDNHQPHFGPRDASVVQSLPNTPFNNFPQDSHRFENSFLGYTNVQPKQTKMFGNANFNFPSYPTIAQRTLSPMNAKARTDHDFTQKLPTTQQRA